MRVLNWFAEETSAKGTKLLSFSEGMQGTVDATVELFRSTFTASENAEEGDAIGRLVTDILNTTDKPDLLIFEARNQGELIGCICFTRLVFDEDAKTVFMLSPVAVKTEHQGKGIGQKLISFGLEKLKREGVDAVVTYGDPNYYSKVGFQPVSTEAVQPPFKLSMPHGWLGLDLSDKQTVEVLGPSSCVSAFEKPAFW